MTCRLHLHMSVSLKPFIRHCPREVTATKITSGCHFCTFFFFSPGALGFVNVNPKAFSEHIMPIYVCIFCFCFWWWGISRRKGKCALTDGVSLMCNLETVHCLDNPLPKTPSQVWNAMICKSLADKNKDE